MFEEQRRVKLITLGVMCFSLFMVMLDNTVVNVALPTMQRHFGSGISGLQWIVDGYILLFASLMLTGGTLGDIYGRKRLFTIGLVIFTAGSALCGLAPSLFVLIGGRALQGVGAAALMPGTLSILTNTFPDRRERAQALGIWAGVSGLALALGPMVGGIMVDTLGWQSIFFLNLPIGVLALVLAAWLVPESSNPAGRRLDLPGQLLAIIGLSSLTYALIEANNYGWGSAPIVGLFVVAAISFAAFVVVERRTVSPVLQLHFFRNPTFAGANLVAFLISFGFFAMLFFLTLFWQEVQGYSAAQAGVRSLPLTVAVMASAIVSGRVVGRIGSRVPMTLGMALLGTGILLLLTVQVSTSYGSMWWILVILGVGNGLVMSPMTAAVMGTVPPARAGMASATTSTTREVGGVFGIAFLGAIVTHRFVSELRAGLERLALPAPLRERIVEAAGHGPQAGGTVPQGLPAAAIRDVVDRSFVSGIHTALWVAGIALLAGSVVAAMLIRETAPGTAPVPVGAAAPGVDPVAPSAN